MVEGSVRDERTVVQLQHGQLGPGRAGLAELLDDEAAPDDVALLALHDREVLRLTASTQLMALHGRE